MSERQYVILGLMFLMIGILTGVYSYLSNELSTQGALLDSLQKQVAQYKKENMTLEDQYLHDAAFTTIQQKAKDRGFTTTPVPIYFTN